MKKKALLIIAIAAIIGIILWLEMQDSGIETETSDAGISTTQADTTQSITTSAEEEQEEPFSPYPKAPEIIGTQAWINSEPLTIASLKGKVVMVDFWTYTCINCIRTLPYLTEWDRKYKDKGLVIIGVHTPEFAFEKKLENVQKAVEKFDVEYAVVQDNDYATWRNYKNHYWPHKYLIDKNGRVRYDHIGEGGYEETERKVQELLAEIGQDVEGMNVTKIEQEDRFRLGMTPELYAGYEFARQPLGNKEGYEKDMIVDYKAPAEISANKVYLHGKWNNNADNLQHADTNEGAILLKFTAKTINIVASPMGKENVELDIYLNDAYVPKEMAGKDVVYDGSRSYVVLDDERLYNLIGQGNEYGAYTIKIATKSPDFFWSAFTFGG